MSITTAFGGTAVQRTGSVEDSVTTTVPPGFRTRSAFGNSA